MKLSYLIMIFLVVKCGRVSAQQLIADSIAKICHVKTVSWTGDDHLKNKSLNSYTEWYDNNGNITEYLDAFYDTSQIPITQPNHRELFYYNGKGQLIRKRVIDYPYYKSKEDSSYTTVTLSYDSDGRLIKRSSTFENAETGSAVTYSYTKHKRKERDGFDDGVTISKYDNKGYLIEEKRKAYDGDFVRGRKIYYISKFFYDSYGRPDTTVSFKKNDSIKYITTQNYNDTNQLIKQTCYMLDTNEKTPVPTHYGNAKYFYDNRGLLIREIGYFPLMRVHIHENPIHLKYTYTYTFY